MKKIAIIVMLLSLPLMAYNMQSLKINQYYDRLLFEMYYYTTQCANFSDEELKEKFDSKFIPFIHTLPKVGTTLKYKGKLEITWSFDVKYNKTIDLIFYPEENPYIYYAELYAKDFPKKFNEDAKEFRRELTSITLPPHINDDFVKEVLAQSDLSKAQQEQFFQVRFGSVFVPMEIEFEWYWYYSAGSIIGVIQSFEVLPPNTPLNFSLFVDRSDEVIPDNVVFAPLPTAAIAYTQTKPNDFIVNVRDKPDSKGKIVTQLLTQEIKIPDNFYSRESQLWRDEHILMGVNPLYEKMVSQGYKWYHKDNENSSTENEGYFMYYQWKTQQAYYKKEKSKLINPLDYKDYLILVWNIEPNEWAKVWILKMINDKDYIMLEGYNSGEKEKRYFENTDIIRSGEYIYLNKYLYLFLDESSYTQTFLESPSTLKLYEGYIHTNSLQYLAPFGQYYIKR